MSYITKKQVNYFILISFFIIVIPYLIYAPFAILLIALFTTTNSLNFLTPYYISALFYILAILILIVALKSLNIINKKYWPQVEGKIVKSEITKDPFSIFRIWTIKYTYKFTFEEKDYYKGCYSKIIFNNEYEARKYLDKVSENDKSSLPVYVFKSHPEFSSINIKVNVFHLFFLYLIIMANCSLIFFGFLARIANDYDISSVTDPTGHTDVFVQLRKIFDIYFSKMDLFLLLLPILILILLTIFIIKSIKMMIQNKIFIFYSRIKPGMEYEENVFGQITYKICTNCNFKNDIESMYCSNCGEYIKN